MNRINILALLFHYHKFKVFLALITFIVLINTIIFTQFYSVFNIVYEDDIVSHLVAEREFFGQDERHLCPLPDFSKHDDLIKPILNASEKSNPWVTALNLLDGGEWQPSDCRPRYLVAIVVPYRNREEHLNVFLRNIHPFLQKQNIHYKIYVVEQADKRDFNRGMLLNIGFIEARKEKPYPCFIFHDVDLIPLNLNNIYACTKLPRHMASSVDKYRFKPPYDRYFGGVLSILSHQFQAVNGFSNSFYGWGGEDDDFFFRVRHAGLGLSRFPRHIARYQSLEHKEAKPSDGRYERLDAGYGAYAENGLNSLHFQIKATIDNPTHVQVVVEL